LCDCRCVEAVEQGESHDATGAGAANDVNVVIDARPRADAFLDLLFERHQDLRRENATHSAAIDRNHAQILVGRELELRERLWRLGSEHQRDEHEHKQERQRHRAAETRVGRHVVERVCVRENERTRATEQKRRKTNLALRNGASAALVV